jgi:hypothetical protein
MEWSRKQGGKKKRKRPRGRDESNMRERKRESQKADRNDESTKIDARPIELPLAIPSGSC